MPTSVQIQLGGVERSRRIAAEKSDPPRPRVVGRPSAVAPLNPVTTGRTPASSSGSRQRRAFSRVASITGEALP
jgi:hypothetical protein